MNKCFSLACLYHKLKMGSNSRLSKLVKSLERILSQHWLGFFLVFLFPRLLHLSVSCRLQSRFLPGLKSICLSLSAACHNCIPFCFHQLSYNTVTFQAKCLTVVFCIYDFFFYANLMFDKSFWQTHSVSFFLFD